MPATQARFGRFGAPSEREACALSWPSGRAVSFGPVSTSLVNQSPARLRRAARLPSSARAARVEGRVSELEWERELSFRTAGRQILCSERPVSDDTSVVARHLDLGDRSGVRQPRFHSLGTKPEHRFVPTGGIAQPGPRSRKP